jgi:hypothetical protein
MLTRESAVGVRSRTPKQCLRQPGGPKPYLDVRSREPRYAVNSRANISGTGAGPADSAKNALKIKPVLVPRPRPGHDQRLEESLDHIAGAGPRLSLNEFRVRTMGPIWAQRSRLTTTQRPVAVGTGAQATPTSGEPPAPPIWGSRGREFKSRQPD